MRLPAVTPQTTKANDIMKTTQTSIADPIIRKNHAAAMPVAVMAAVAALLCGEVKAQAPVDPSVLFSEDFSGVNPLENFNLENPPGGGQSPMAIGIDTQALVMDYLNGFGVAVADYQTSASFKDTFFDGELRLEASSPPDPRAWGSINWVNGNSSQAYVYFGLQLDENQAYVFVYDGISSGMTSAQIQVDRNVTYQLRLEVRAPDIIKGYVNGQLVTSMNFDLGNFPATMNPGVSANSSYPIRNRYDNLVVRTINQPPSCDAGADQTLECAGALTPTQLNGAASSDPDGDSITYEWTVADGSGAVIENPSSIHPTGWFPIGATMVTLIVTDGNGGFDTDDMLVVVQDTTAPVVVCTTDVASLWPPNHRMVAVRIFLNVADVGASPQDFSVMCQVSSSEADDARGDGKSTGDVNGTNGYISPVPVALTYDPQSGMFTGRVNLRAERDGSKKGRTYSITAVASDPSGNSSSANCVVVVPHDMGKK